MMPNTGETNMKAMRRIATFLRRKIALTPEQATLLASVKFPCC